MSPFKSQIPQLSKRGRESRVSDEHSFSEAFVKSEGQADNDTLDGSPKKRARKLAHTSSGESAAGESIPFEVSSSRAKFKPSVGSRRTNETPSQMPAAAVEGLAGSGKRTRKPTQKVLDMLDNPLPNDCDESPSRPPPVNRSTRPARVQKSKAVQPLFVKTEPEPSPSPVVFANDSDSDIVVPGRKGKEKEKAMPVIEVDESDEEVTDSPLLKSSFRSILSPTLDRELESDVGSLDQHPSPAVDQSGRYASEGPFKPDPLTTDKESSDEEEEIKLLEQQIALLKAKSKQKTRQANTSSYIPPAATPDTPKAASSAAYDPTVDDDVTPRPKKVVRKQDAAFQDGSDRTSRTFSSRRQAHAPVIMPKEPVLCALKSWSKEGPTPSKPLFLNVNAVAPDLEELHLQSIVAADAFETFPPFANFSRIDPSLLAYDSSLRVIWPDNQHHAVGIMLGSVTDCSVVQPFASTAPGALDTKWSRKITITPTSAGLKGFRAFLAKVFNASSLKASFENGSDLTFTTRKDGIAARAGAGSKASNQKRNNKYFSGDSEDDNSLPWHARPFPAFLEYSADLPLYDARENGFLFDKDGFDNLQALPRFVWPGTRPNADLPYGSIVAVAYTANVFKSTFGQSPSKYQQSPGPYASPAAKPEAQLDLSLCLNIQFAIMLGQVPPASP